MKRYDENFKIEALKLSDEIGVKKACEQLNVNYGTLAGWRKQRVKKTKERKSTDADIQKENNRLKKEIAELKSANEIQDQFGYEGTELVNEGLSRKFCFITDCTALTSRNSIFFFFLIISADKLEGYPPYTASFSCSLRIRFLIL